MTIAPFRKSTVMHCQEFHRTLFSETTRLYAESPSCDAAVSIIGVYQKSLQSPHLLPTHLRLLGAFEHGIEEGSVNVVWVMQGVVETRSCTDVVWLIFFIAFWIGMFIVLGTAVSQGTIFSLVNVPWQAMPRAHNLFCSPAVFHACQFSLCWTI